MIAILLILILAALCIPAVRKLFRHILQAAFGIACIALAYWLFVIAAGGNG